MCSLNQTLAQETLCAPLEIFFLCGTAAYKCLEMNWTGICIKVFLTPDISILTEHEFETALNHPARSKRAAFIPLLIVAGIAMGVGTGVAGLGTSGDFYHKPSQELNDDIERVADSLSCCSKAS